MDILQIKNLDFTYPDSEHKAVCGVNLSMPQGSFGLIFGASGCGKTTLLRLLKPQLAPYGQKSGEILYCNQPIDELSDKISAFEIGFVGQNPDDQLVTDKVWRELAFGLESMGVESSAIRRRVAETASYFGITGWYGKSTDELSGGQKQILNLASVMVTSPKLLLLDEPTSRLDPISASGFITTVQKLNRELGVTVLMVEHRLEEIYSACDFAVAMSGGRTVCCGSPRSVCTKLRNSELLLAMPSAARIFNSLDVDCECPLTVREGRQFLQKYFADSPKREIEPKPKIRRENAIFAKNLWFRYEKCLPDVLKGTSLKVGKGEIYTILGGNGTGKTTLLNVLAALDKPYRGSVKIFDRKIDSYKSNALYRRTLAFLPQNPKSVFIKNTVREDFLELLGTMNISKKQQEQTVALTAQKFGIENLLNRHPYDLSGGEQQKCALAKLLLTQPKILLLDEPTKGMDAYSKQSLAVLLKDLRMQGKTILIVSHDMEFSAQVSDTCAMFFDGEIISQDSPREFFSDNNFYTTPAGRISRGIFKNTVLCEEVVSLCSTK